MRIFVNLSDIYVFWLYYQNVQLSYGIIKERSDRRYVTSVTSLRNTRIGSKYKSFTIFGSDSFSSVPTIYFLLAEK